MDVPATLRQTNGGDFIERLLTGPIDAELPTRDIALLAAHLHNHRPHASWWQQHNRGIKCPELEQYQKLKTIFDFNLNLQAALAPTAQGLVNSKADSTPSAAKTEHGESGDLGSCSPLAGRGEDVSPAICLAGVGRSKNAEAEQTSVPKVFSSGDMVFYSDRVELCGVDICSGARSKRRRDALNLLQVRLGNRFAAYSGEELAQKVGLTSGQNGAAGLIRDIRSEIPEALCSQANIECLDEDVILSGGPGYRFSEKISVQDGCDTASRKDQGHGPGNRCIDVPDVPNPHVPNIPNVRDNVAGIRRAWILQQLAEGRRLNAPDVAEWFKCSVKTAQRDLQALKEEGRIEFVGAPRTGYYRERKPPESGQ